MREFVKLVRDFVLWHTPRLQELVRLAARRRLMPYPVKLPQLRANVAANGLDDRVTLIGKALAEPDIIAECLSPRALERLWQCASGFGCRHAYRIDHDGPVPVTRGGFRPANYLLTAAPRPVNSLCGQPWWSRPEAPV